MIENSPCVDFLRRLIQTESMPGEEGAVAQLVREEMEKLGYDEAYLDEAGNVIGLLRGEGKSPPVMFNTHLDHVGVGETRRWPHPPFGGEVHGGMIWGRGAVDIKGPLAAQVHGVARLISEGTRPPGDVYVTAVVQEEVGGLGARHLLNHLKLPIVIVGEPSSNEIRRGHRGRTELVVHVRGRSVHASVPERGINPLEVLADFILRVKDLKMRQSEDLGSSSVAVTLIRTDQVSANVVPAEAWLTCDWRNIPEESGEQVRSILQRLADESLTDGSQADVEIPVTRRTSYTGLELEIPSMHPAFVTPSDHGVVAATRDILSSSIGLQAEVGFWRFATDGGHFAAAGLTIIGFGPGEETLAHTIQEAIDLEELEAAVVGNRALALELPSKIS